MIENDFDEKDTLEERVEKFNGQTGLGLTLREDGRGRFYLEREGSYFTGAMRPHELRHWTADFARGFRLGHEAASSPEALALARRFKTAIATAQWELGLDAFCQLLGFNPEHEHGPEKFRSFTSLATALNQFDARSIATILEWQAAKEQTAGEAHSGAIGAPRGSQPRVLSGEGN